MSPTVFIYKGYRFFFFSREEKKPHVHVHCANGEAKFWLTPEVAIAENYGLSNKQIREALSITKERKDEITDGWKKHFRG